MTTHHAPRQIAIDTSRIRVQPLRLLGRLLRDVWFGLDAATLIAHGVEPPLPHPARHRDREQQELDRRLAARSPRT